VEFKGNSLTWDAFFTYIQSFKGLYGGILNLKEGGNDERRNEIKNKEDRCFVYL